MGFPPDDPLSECRTSPQEGEDFPGSIGAVSVFFSSWPFLSLASPEQPYSPVSKSPRIASLNARLVSRVSPFEECNRYLGVDC